MIRDGKLLPTDYFETGIFRNALPGELMAVYTCQDCFVRFKVFAAFREHRRRGDCRDTGPRPGWLEHHRAA